MVKIAIVIARNFLLTLSNYWAHIYFDAVKIICLPLILRIVR